MKIAVIGAGDVRQVLASGFLKHGHEVVTGTRDPAKLAAWAKANHQGRVAGFTDAAKFGETVVLAVKSAVAVEALAATSADALAGKVVVDGYQPHRLRAA